MSFYSKALRIELYEDGDSSSERYQAGQNVWGKCNIELENWLNAKDETSLSLNVEKCS